jgi:hypothetical protein
MKPLIFTFFAIVLCYSLFFDNEPGVLGVDELNYIYEEASPAIYMSKDTLDPCSYTYSFANRMNNMRSVYSERYEDSVQLLTDLDL